MVQAAIRCPLLSLHAAELVKCCFKTRIVSFFVLLSLLLSENYDSLGAGTWLVSFARKSNCVVFHYFMFMRQRVLVCTQEC